MTRAPQTLKLAPPRSDRRFIKDFTLISAPNLDTFSVLPPF